MLVVEELGKTFGGLTALFGINFEVEKGSITGIIGPNGAGKTTMFNLISGTLLPTSGSIRFKGRDITEIRSNKVCRMGYRVPIKTQDLLRPFQSCKTFSLVSFTEERIGRISKGQNPRP
jgi:ABC-type branched-subunit amino acid transport system ATPase component